MQTHKFHQLGNESVSMKSSKFSAYKIVQNDIHSGVDDSEYIFQHPKISKGKLKVYEAEDKKVKINKEVSVIGKMVESKGKCLMDELCYRDEMTQKWEEKQDQDQQNDQQIDDFTELWNNMQTKNQNQAEILQNSKVQKINKQSFQNQQQKNETRQSNESYDESSCELNEQQMANLMMGVDCNIKSEIKQNIDSNKNWGSWSHIAAEFQQTKVQQNGSQNIIEMNQFQLAQIVQANSSEKQLTSEFQIIDGNSQLNIQSHTYLPYVYPFNSTTETEQQKQQTYGPKLIQSDLYELHEDYSLKLIHKINCPQSIQGFPYKKVENPEKAIKKINWEISEERKPNIMALKIKRNCKSKLVEHGKDFLIFDHRKFLTSPIHENAHIYLGARAYGDNSNDNLQNKIKGEHKQYLFLPSSGQCLLETVYDQKGKKNGFQMFSIVMSLTQQKIAVCTRHIESESRDKREVIQVRAYDCFQNRVSHFLGVIESKISKFSDQWYCDTIIYYPKKTTSNFKINQKDWQKLKIHLRLSQSGSIVAELGIFDAKSSITNSILFNETKTSQFMMGTIEQLQFETNYILRISGISPILGFATLLSRRFFVNL